MADELSPLARRLRRLAVVVAALAAAAAVFGLVPDGMDLYEHRTKLLEATTCAGGWPVVVWAFLQVVSTRPVYGEPTRALALVWIVWSLLLDLGGTFAWVVGKANLMHAEARWPGHMMGYCALATAVLVFVVVPIVLLVSSRQAPSDAPDARVVS